MKTIFKLGSIEVQGVKINDIEVTQEYTAKEAIDLVFAGKSFVKSLIKDLPEMLEDLEVVSNKFNGIDERVESKDMTKELEDFIKEINKNEDNCPFKVVGITRRG
jgi:tRNA G37 N-methylase TrmD